MRTRVALVVLLAVTSALTGRASAAEQQVPPMLLFARGGDLYRMAVDGSETARLTATKAVEADPAVSADGLRIAFTRGTKAGVDELWVGDLRGRNQRKIVGKRPAAVRYAATGDPAWSSDDRWIYLARSAQTSEICGWIYRVGADGHGLTRVTRGDGLDTSPSPSPDGSRIALSAGECMPGLDCCWLVVVDNRGRPTSDLKRLPSTPGAQFAPAWSPDGARIAFEVNDPGTGVSSIRIVDRDGSNLVRVTPRGLNAEDPAWSPDGEWIAFVAWTRSAPRYDLYMVRPDGSGLQRLTTTKADESSPAWIRRN